MNNQQQIINDLEAQVERLTAENDGYRALLLNDKGCVPEGCDPIAAKEAIITGLRAQLASVEFNTTTTITGLKMEVEQLRAQLAAEKESGMRNAHLLIAATANPSKYTNELECENAMQHLTIKDLRAQLATIVTDITSIIAVPRHLWQFKRHNTRTKLIHVRNDIVGVPRRPLRRRSLNRGQCLKRWIQSSNG